MTEVLVLRRASTAPGRVEDLAIVGGRFVDPTTLGRSGEEVDLEGRPVLPGLADHHVHLFALAAADRSVDLSPEALDAAGGLGGALRAARLERPTGWLRGIGYDVSTSGPLDRSMLDAAVAGPVRVQDRTGIRWILDSRALDAVLPADPRDRPAGVEVDDGRPTGVLTRLDHWLGHRVPAEHTDLAAVGRRLAGFGITAVTDAGADNAVADLEALAGAGLPLRVAAMTREPVVEPVAGIGLGAVKVLLDDADLPSLDVLAARVSAAHAAGRAVAVHCVTAVQLVLALSAGIGPADRIEHASMVPDGVLAMLASAGPTVVVQPGLVLTRGDHHLRDIAREDPDDLAGLHRLASLRQAGVRVAAGSDAPYGPADPWTTIEAAVRRRTRSGAELGGREAVDATDAVGLLTGRLDAPAIPRSLRPGEPADLVVLDDDWTALADHPPIRATLLAGAVTAGAL